MEAGEYRGAIESFEEALLHHGKRSAVLENRIAQAYVFLGLDELAVVHYSNAVEIQDDAFGRINRAKVYVYNGQCDWAVEDAAATLDMEPFILQGALHSDAEAHMVIANCYAYTGDFNGALHHLEAAMAIADEYQYPDAYMAASAEWLDELCGAVKE